MFLFFSWRKWIDHIGATSSYSKVDSRYIFVTWKKEGNLDARNQGKARPL
jgi:hypothetical protein